MSDIKIADMNAYRLVKVKKNKKKIKKIAVKLLLQYGYDDNKTKALANCAFEFSKYSSASIEDAVIVIHEVLEDFNRGYRPVKATRN